MWRTARSPWRPAIDVMPYTIAVTGASGFIGRRLVEKLCRDGNGVRALVRERSIDVEVPKDSLEIIKGSLDDPASLADLVDGVDAVVHLAGLIKARQRRDFFNVNAGGVARLVEAMSAAQTRAKLVLISSLAAREPSLSAYAASKRCGEAVLLDVPKDLPWTILRPPAVYGPGDRETLSFFKGLRLGIGVMLGGREARFSLIHVDDLVAAIIAVTDRDCADRLILELDDGLEQGHSWPSMITVGEQVMEVKARKIAMPPMALTALGYLNAGLRIVPGYTPMLTPEKARELTHPDWVADRRLILAETGWRPGIAVDRGFQATVDWYQLHSWL